MNVKLLPATVVLALGVGFLPTLSGQVVITSSELTYTQNFNTLPLILDGTGTDGNRNSGTASNKWTNNVTLLGWYGTRDTGTNTNYATRNGNDLTSTNRLINLGPLSTDAANPGDRALGLFASTIPGGDPNIFGLRLVNNTGTTLTGFSLSFTGEQWSATANASSSLNFAFSLGATSLTAGTYTNFAGLDYTSTVNTITAASALTSPLATTAISDSITGLEWTNGQELWVRWTKGNDNHHLGIDDLTFVAIPEPSTGLLILGALLVFLARRQGRRTAV